MTRPALLGCVPRGRSTRRHPHRASSLGVGAAAVRSTMREWPRPALQAARAGAGRARGGARRGEALPARRRHLAAAAWAAGAGDPARTAGPVHGGAEEAGRGAGGAPEAGAAASRSTGALARLASVERPCTGLSVRAYGWKVRRGARQVAGRAVGITPEAALGLDRCNTSPGLANHLEGAQPLPLLPCVDYPCGLFLECFGFKPRLPPANSFGCCHVSAPSSC